MQKLAVWLTDYVIRKGAVKAEEKEIYQYGFERALETVLNLIISVLIAVPLHMVIEGVLFFLIFIPLRSYAGGLHLEHYISCLILSCLTYFAILLTVKFISIPIALSTVSLFLLMVSVWLLYPVEHVNRSVDEAEDAYFRKRLKQFLLADSLAAALCLLFGRERYLSLMAVTFFLIVSTMVIGKVKAGGNYV